MSSKRNVEIKATISNICNTLEKAKVLSNGIDQIVHQEDHFYNAQIGRLKLRIIQGEEAQLISYNRPNEVGPKLSTYSIAACKDVDNLKNVLSTSLGILGSVKKIRHLFFIQNTRIHIDEVDNLGNFIEFEVVLDENQTLEDGQVIAEDLMDKFGIQNSDLISCAYLDMIMCRK